MEGDRPLIICKDKTFYLQTKNSSYIFRVTEHGHLEHIFYGTRLPVQPVDSLCLKRTAVYGSSVLYSQEDPTYCLDNMTLEWSGSGRGDYRHSPAEIRMPDGTFVSDFAYKHYVIKDGCPENCELPLARGVADECQTLIIDLEDPIARISLQLVYCVYMANDVITRRTILTNKSHKEIEVRKLMSLMLDLPDQRFRMTSLHGAWIREGQRQETRLPYGILVLESTTGASSNRQNPAFCLATEDATEDSGHVYGFNLVYSGNHYSAVQKSEQNLVRIMTGINPSGFSWTVKMGEVFSSPEAVLTFSSCGIGGMSRNFHDFINRHIVAPYWQGRNRPVLINSWETFMFDYNQRGLLNLARQASDLGIELFVLDDGWFGQRDHDKAGLGDYEVNRKKIPGGLKPFAEKLNNMGLQFGLWFEPEMINQDSDLYRTHPDFAVKIPGRKPLLGRNQLVLDLTREDVRDYIVTQVGDVLDSAPISYVKWDMNRHISDMYSPLLENQGEFFHRYILGLYEILKRIFLPRPEILLESCSSGGNRFDLGMLCFSPQIWTSDNTDPIERLRIQEGLSLFYPLSTMGAHVSASPHQQTLRTTSLATRFNAACFGCLGYELNLDQLSKQDKQEIKKQIECYKEQRALLQFGSFYRLRSDRTGQIQWQVISADKKNAVVALFQTVASSAPAFDRLYPQSLEPDQTYVLKSFERKLRIRRFGGLVNHISPVKIHPEGVVLRLADQFYSLPGCHETYTATGSQLMAGVMLKNAFNGTGYSEQIRMMGDFDSDIYLIKEVNEHDTKEKDDGKID